MEELVRPEAARQADGSLDRLALLALAVLIVCLLQLPVTGAQGEERPAGVIDLHVDLSYQLNYKQRDLQRASGQYLASELLASGVEGVVLPLFVPHDVSKAGPRLQDFESSYQAMLSELKKTQPYSLPGAELPNRVRTWFSFEGVAPFAGASERIAQWVGRGAAVFGLVHTQDNVLATSAGKGPAARQVKGGLTAEGRVVAERVLQAGGVLDVSHASDAAAWELVRLSQRAGRPVVATHSNARAVTDHARNIPDDLGLAIARTGGVIGVNFHTPFLSSSGAASIDDVVRHVKHWVRVVGVEHVAIGSDFEGGIRAAKGLDDVRGFPALARALQKSGLSGQQVRQVFGLNALRVLCQHSRAPQTKCQ